MSALPPKADMCSALTHVRFVPIADIVCGADYSAFCRSRRFGCSGVTDFSTTYSWSAARTRGGVVGFVMIRSIVFADNSPNLCLFFLIVQTVERCRPSAFAC